MHVPSTRSKSRQGRLKLGLVAAPKGLSSWIENVFRSHKSAEAVKAMIGQKLGLVQFLRSRESVTKSAVDWVLSGEHQQALQLLQAAHIAEAPLKQNTYENVAFYLAGEREWDAVLSVVDKGLEATGKTSARLLNWKARALIESEDFAKLDGVLEEFTRRGIKPQRLTYELLLTGYLRNHELSQARSVMLAMERAGFKIDATTFARILPAYRGLGEDRFIHGKAHENLRTSNGDALRRIFNGLLHLLLDNRNLEAVFSLLDTFGSKQVLKPSSIAGGGECIKLECAPLADAATYTMLIDYFTKLRHLHSLNSILDRSRRCHTALDARFAAALVRMYFALGLDHVALRIFQKCYASFKLDLQAMMRLGLREDAEAIPDFGTFEGDGSPELLNSVLQGAISRAGVSAMNDVLILMRDVNVEPDEQTLAIFLTSLDEQGFLSSDEIGHTLDRMLRPNLRPSLKHLNLVLKTVVRSSKHMVHGTGWSALASEVTHNVQAASYPDAHAEQPTSDSEPLPAPLTDPDLGIIERQSAKLRTHLAPLLDSLIERGIKADRATFALRLRYDSYTLHPSQIVKSTEAVLQEMRNRGLHPTTHHYAALLTAHCEAGDVASATEILHDLIHRNVLPHRDSYAILFTILISAHARTGRPDRALKSFRSLLSAGINPDAAAVDAVVGAFFAVRAYGLARRVLLDFWPMVMPTPLDDEMRQMSLAQLITFLRKSRRDGVSVPRRAAGRGEAKRLLDKAISAWQRHSKGDEGSGGASSMPRKQRQRTKEHMTL